MKEYKVVIASYVTVLVDADDEQDAEDIAMEIFEPSDEWVIAEVEEIKPYPIIEENE